MSTKIQINSLEALERLIGNDNEVEIQIRNSIVHEFTKKHLKILAEGDVFKTLHSTIVKEIESQYFIKESKYPYKISVSPALKDVAETDIRNTVNKIVSEAITKAVEANINLDKINERLDIAATYIAEQLTEHALEQKLNTLVDKKIKEKLGLS